MVLRERPPVPGPEHYNPHGDWAESAGAITLYVFLGIFGIGVVVTCFFCRKNIDPDQDPGRPPTPDPVAEAERKRKRQLRKEKKKAKKEKEAARVRWLDQQPMFSPIELDMPGGWIDGAVA